MDGLLKYSVDQARDYHGRWTDGNTVPKTSEEKLMAEEPAGSPYKQTGYVEDHDNKLWRNDQGQWGGSHSDSSFFAERAAGMMGIPGWDKERVDASGFPIKLTGDYSVTDRRVTDLLQTIHDSPGSKEPLYHGFANRNGMQFNVGDTLKIPLMATAGEMGTVGYGVRQHDQPVGQPTLFELPKGTKIAGYSAWRKSDDFGHKWSEAITGGEFRVESVKTVRGISHAWWDPAVTIVRLKPIGTFNPSTKAWEKL